MDLISVIVPVFKAEAYLDQCVQSIVDQTYRNLEIILVDDGSPDRCPQMCDEWARKDSRIRVIHKENGGGGGARNAALDIVQGDFVGMVDSDDYIAPDMYAHLHALMQGDVDIAECEILLTEGSDAQLSDGTDAEVQTYPVQEAMKLHIQDVRFRQTPPNKLYRRNTVEQVRFPVGTRIDDEFWTYQAIGNARKLVHSTAKMYAYRQQAGSVMHLSFALPRLQAVDAKCARLAYIKSRFPELTATARTNLYYTCLYMGQMTLLHMDQKDQETSFQKILTALTQNPIQKSDLSEVSPKQQLWLKLASRHFRLTCRLRNLLKIGI